MLVFCDFRGNQRFVPRAIIQWFPADVTLLLLTVEETQQSVATSVSSHSFPACRAPLQEGMHSAKRGRGRFESMLLHSEGGAFGRPSNMSLSSDLAMVSSK